MNLRYSVVLIAALFCCGGCIEQSVVIKVQRDGSAVVHVRSFSEEPDLPFGGTDEKIKRKLPTEETMQKVASEVGEGVHLKELREATNSSGWQGFEAIFECENVNTVEFDLERLMVFRLADKKKSDSKKPGPLSGVTLRFQQNGESLEIINEVAEQHEPAAASETRDPFAKSDPLPKINPIGMSIASSIIKRARIGVFVQVEGGIQSTTAKHHDGDLITLSRIEGPKMNETDVVELLSLGQATPSPERLQELAERANGLDWDMQSKIEVTRR